MSAPGQNVQQLQQDIYRELYTANQLLSKISAELNKIKIITNPGGELEMAIKNNASILSELAKLQQIDLTLVPPRVRQEIADAANRYGSKPCEEQNTPRNESDMDGS